MKPISSEVVQGKPEEVVFIEDWFTDRGYNEIRSTRDKLGFWEIANSDGDFFLSVKKSGTDFIIQLIDFSGGALGLGSVFMNSLIEKSKQIGVKRIVANNCSPSSLDFYRKNNFQFIGLNAQKIIS